MAESYFFDKRVLKKNAIKYLIIFIIILPIFIGLNILLNGLTASWVIILIDVMVGAFLLIGLGYVYDIINNKRIAKKEQRIKEFKKRQRLANLEVEDEKIEIQEEKTPKTQPKKKRKRRNRNKGIN